MEPAATEHLAAQQSAVSADLVELAAAEQEHLAAQQSAVSADLVELAATEHLAAQQSAESVELAATEHLAVTQLQQVAVLQQSAESVELAAIAVTQPADQAAFHWAEMALAVTPQVLHPAQFHRPTEPELA
jgi:hypothetical protein